MARVRYVGPYSAVEIRKPGLPYSVDRYEEIVVTEEQADLLCEGDFERVVPVPPTFTNTAVPQED